MTVPCLKAPGQPKLVTLPHKADKNYEGLVANCGAGRKEIE